MPRRSGFAVFLVLALLFCHGALGSVHQLSAYSGPGVDHGTSHETVLHPDSVGTGVAGASYYATSLLALGAFGLALGLLSLVRVRSPWVSLAQSQVLRLAKRSLQGSLGPPGLARLQVFRI